MKKLTKTLLMSSFLIGGIMTSCSDDTIVFDDSQYPELEVGAPDIANGCHVLLIDIDNFKERALELGTKKNVDVTIEDSNEFPMDWEMVREEDGTHYLKLIRFKDNGVDLSEPKAFNLNIKTRDGSQEKDVRLVLRKKSSAYIDGIPAEYQNYYNTIGWSMVPWSAYGETKAPILRVEYGGLDIHPNLNDRVDKEWGGTRYQETIQNVANEIGLNFKAKDKGIDGAKTTIFSGGAEMKVSSQKKQWANYEFYMGVTLISRTAVSWNKDKLTGIIERGDLVNYLDSAANSVFNVETDTGYKQYNNNDTASLSSLLNKYGAFVISRATFGGTHIYTYSRVENGYENTIGADIAANIKGQESDGTKPKRWLEQYQAQHADFIQMKDSLSITDKDYWKATDTDEYSWIRGGSTVSDLDAWAESIYNNEGESVVVKYRTASDDDPEDCLIPIYEFMTPGSARREAIEAHFADYVNSRMKTPEEMTMVLADMRMVHYSEGRHETESMRGEPKSIVSVGPDGNQYVYFPMMANSNFPDASDIGYAADTSMADFLHGGREGSDYWFYAMGYRELGCNGLTNLTFHGDSWVQDEANEKEIDKRRTWFHTGDEANAGGKAVHHNYVCSMLAGPTTSNDRVIKAAALYIVPDEEDYDKPAYNYIFASTGGSELKRGNSNLSDFKSYWGDAYGDAKGDTDCEFFYSAGFNTYANRFRIIFNFNDLPFKSNGLSLGFGQDGTNEVIQHPLKWGSTDNNVNK